MPSVIEAGHNSKIVQAEDDAMSPVIEPGDYVQVEPGLMPRPKQIVMVVDREGRAFLRQFRQRAGGAFDAISLDPAYAPMRSEDGISIVAVAVSVTRRLL